MLNVVQCMRGFRHKISENSRWIKKKFEINSMSLDFFFYGC